ncbi:hypothetical protein HI914_06235 [Erysiphe necator]|nr:hypothetical protein HI914_06235 [Erysiphe necator]
MHASCFMLLRQEFHSGAGTERGFWLAWTGVGARQFCFCGTSKQTQPREVGILRSCRALKTITNKLDGGLPATLNSIE